MPPVDGVACKDVFKRPLVSPGAHESRRGWISCVRLQPMWRHLAVASVYLERDTWYLKVIDAGGRCRCIASTAGTKTEPTWLVVEIERRFERQRLVFSEESL